MRLNGPLPASIRCAVGLGLALSLQACASTTAGTPSTAGSTVSPTAHTSTPSGQTSSQTSTAAPDLARLDPCTLLRPDEFANLGFTAPPKPDTIVGRSGCGSSKPNASLAVYVDPRRGLADLNVKPNNRVENRTIDGRQGRLAEDPAGYCYFDIAVTEKSSVTVTVLFLKHSAEACTIAEHAAALVAPRLPKG